MDFNEHIHITLFSHDWTRVCSDVKIKDKSGRHSSPSLLNCVVFYFYLCYLLTSFNTLVCLFWRTRDTSVDKTAACKNLLSFCFISWKETIKTKISANLSSLSSPDISCLLYSVGETLTLLYSVLSTVKITNVSLMTGTVLRQTQTGRSLWWMVANTTTPMMLFHDVSAVLYYCFDWAATYCAISRWGKKVSDRLSLWNKK